MCELRTSGLMHSIMKKGWRELQRPKLLYWTNFWQTVSFSMIRNMLTHAWACQMRPGMSPVSSISYYSNSEIDLKNIKSKEIYSNVRKRLKTKPEQCNGDYSQVWVPTMPGCWMYILNSFLFFFIASIYLQIYKIDTKSLSRS